MQQNKYLVGITLLVGVALIILRPQGISFSLIALALGFGIVFLTSEPMVEGLKDFGVQTRLSPHITGVLSSMASNLPEAVMTGFMIMSPDLKEVAILTVMLASAFNGLLLGLLVVMMTYNGGAVEMPKEKMEQDIEIMRIAIALCTIVFGTGLILNIFCTGEMPVLPREIPIFLLLGYGGYLYFLTKRNALTPHVEINDKEHGKNSWLAPIVIGLVGILIAAELISESSEYIVHMYNLHVAIAATVIGLAGSVPEHGIALIGARKGHVELGVSNLLSGIVQSIMLIFPLLALLVPIQLDGYILYQFMANAVTLWIVKKSIIDDNKLTLDEGFSIILIQLLGIILFDELSFLL